jgi:hypothetical protein
LVLVHINRLFRISSISSLQQAFVLLLQFASSSRSRFIASIHSCCSIQLVSLIFLVFQFFGSIFTGLGISFCFNRSSRLILIKFSLIFFKLLFIMIIFYFTF